MLLSVGCNEPIESSSGENQNNEKQITNKKSINYSDEEIDSMVDARLSYMIQMVGDTAIFEKHYERSVEDIRKEYIQIYKDSLN